ncbi:MAG: ElyC/SanA/YdcF family protein [Patescibacteria group bacterium]
MQRLSGNELTEIYHIARERIVLEEKSYSTLTELFELCKLCREKGWRQVGVVTNRYHIPRVNKMFKMLSELALPSDEDLKQSLQYISSGSVEVIFVAAEDILAVRHRLYANLDEQLAQTEAYQGRVTAEAKGIADLELGRYRGTT